MRCFQLLQPALGRRVGLLSMLCSVRSRVSPTCWLFAIRQNGLSPLSTSVLTTLGSAWLETIRDLRVLDGLETEIAARSRGPLFLDFYSAERRRNDATLNPARSSNLYRLGQLPPIRWNTIRPQAGIGSQVRFILADPSVSTTSGGWHGALLGTVSRQAPRPDQLLDRCQFHRLWATGTDFAPRQLQTMEA
jgi:hypothetical protein